jgi:hypothetical protein
LRKLVIVMGYRRRSCGLGSVRSTPMGSVACTPLEFLLIVPIRVGDPAGRGKALVTAALERVCGGRRFDAFWTVALEPNPHSPDEAAILSAMMTIEG